jgi:drug/metabolite transporter (DMT)-like permease
VPRHTPSRHATLAAICYATCALIWGTTWFVIRESIAHDGRPGFPPYLASALRFTAASVLLAGLVAAGLGRPLPSSSRQFIWLIAAGVVNGIGYALVYTAEQTIPGGLMAVLFGTIPLMTAVASTVLRIEQVTRRQVLGALIAVAGIAVISSDGLRAGTAQPSALGAALAAVLSATVYSVLVRYGMRDVHPLSGTAVFLWATTIVAWIPALPEVGQLPWPLPARATVATLYLAVLGSVVAFACYAWLVKHVSLMTANSLVLVQPIIALLLDLALERHARMAPLTWIGVVITLSAVFMGALAGRPAASRVART